MPGKIYQSIMYPSLSPDTPSDLKKLSIDTSDYRKKLNLKLISQFMLNCLTNEPRHFNLIMYLHWLN